MFKNVLAGLAVVAAVTAVAVLCVATLGAGAVVIGAVAAGAAISGTAAVASMDVSDIMRGEVSDVDDYMMSAFRESTIGAISGAVFGPFGTMATIGGKMGMGAATNAFESVIRQGMEGNGFSFKTLVMDAGIGAVTAGVLDSRIAKATGRAIKQQGTKAVGNTIAQGVKATGGAIKQGAKAIGEGSKQAAAWLSNGAKKAEKQFNEQLKRLAEAGSTLASRFQRPMAFADRPGGSFRLSKVEPTPEPKLNDRQLNYRQVMAEAEARARAGGKPLGKIDDTPPAFKQTEFASSYEARLIQTPAPENPKVGFEGIRGESK